MIAAVLKAVSTVKDWCYSLQKGREIENIAHHVLRVVGYEAGHVWGQATIKAPQLPSPADFGWTWEVANAQWNMKWMTFPPAGAACRATIKCGCTNGCRSLCKSRRQTLRAQCCASVVDVDKTTCTCCVRTRIITMY